jgi:hypothetical protein
MQNVNNTQNEIKVSNLVLCTFMNITRWKGR